MIEVFKDGQDDSKKELLFTVQAEDEIASNILADFIISNGIKNEDLSCFAFLSDGKEIHLLGVDLRVANRFDVRWAIKSAIEEAHKPVIEEHEISKFFMSMIRQDPGTGEYCLSAEDVKILHERLKEIDYVLNPLVDGPSFLGVSRNTLVAPTRTRIDILVGDIRRSSVIAEAGEVVKFVSYQQRGSDE